MCYWYTALHMLQGVLKNVSVCVTRFKARNYEDTTYSCGIIKLLKFENCWSIAWVC
jgi:hypothetical protein